ncbi:MAG TPA: recombinase family protein [Nocardioidaceae bacterium]|nr:recombinase family protein [Nocardioidaceae bacterium]
MRAIGYTRVSADAHDLAAERSALVGFGVREDRIFVDYGLTGARRDHPGLDQALAACGPGDLLVVTKLHRLAGSLADAREIGKQLAACDVRLMLDGRVHDHADPASRIMFRTLAALADFEADLVRSRTREGLRAAKAQGRLRGKPPKLDPEQQARLVDLHHSEDRSPEDLAEMFGVARSTVYRVLERARRGAIQPVPQQR